MPIPDFVLGLRAAVGTDLLWLPGVSAVVIDEDGRILLGQRADNRNWAVISGILEPGEDPAPAAVREVREETGVHCRVVALTAVSVSPVVTYPNGDCAQYLDLCFWGTPTGGSTGSQAHVADDESVAVGWFAPDRLPTPLASTSGLRIARTLQFIAAEQAGGRPQPWFAAQGGASLF